MDWSIGYESVSQALHLLFVVGVPVAVVSAVVGVICAVFQTVTAIHDPSLPYIIKISAIVLVISSVISATVQGVSDLLMLALK